jgi:hypothetical protein
VGSPSTHTGAALDASQSSVDASTTLRVLHHPYDHPRTFHYAPFCFTRSCEAVGFFYHHNVRHALHGVFAAEVARALTAIDAAHCHRDALVRAGDAVGAAAVQPGLVTFSPRPLKPIFAIYLVSVIAMLNEMGYVGAASEGDELVLHTSAALDWPFPCSADAALIMGFVVKYNLQVRALLETQL